MSVDTDILLELARKAERDGPDSQAQRDYDKHFALLSRTPPSPRKRTIKENIERGRQMMRETRDSE